MATRAQKVKLGIFLLVAGGLIVASLAILIGLNTLEVQDKYHIEFRESVSGLEVGAPVKLRGVQIGTVRNIQVAPKNVEIIRVKIVVKARAPIKRDTKAYIRMQGITGLKYLELSGGTNEAEPLPDGGTIEAGKGAFAAITGRAEQISIKAEKLVNNLLYMTRPENQTHFDSIVQKTDKALSDIAALTDQGTKLAKQGNALLEDNKKTIDAFLNDLQTITSDLRKAVETIEKTASSVKTSMDGANVPETFAQLRQTNALIQGELSQMELGKAVKRATKTVTTLEQIMSRVNQTVGESENQVRSIVSDLRATSESLKRFSRLIEERPSRILMSRQPKERDIP